MILLDLWRMQQPAKPHPVSYSVNRLLHETSSQVQAHHGSARCCHLSHESQASHLGQPQILFSFSAKHPVHRAHVRTAGAVGTARKATTRAEQRQGPMTPVLPFGPPLPSATIPAPCVSTSTVSCLLSHNNPANPQAWQHKRQRAGDWCSPHNCQH